MRASPRRRSGPWSRPGAASGAPVPAKGGATGGAADDAREIAGGATDADVADVLELESESESVSELDSESEFSEDTARTLIEGASLRQPVESKHVAQNPAGGSTLMRFDLVAG